jgi:vacuolar-type H+-ATPase subunit H
MATEALRKVRETEEKAEDLIHNGYDEADRILSDARIDAGRMQNAALDRVRREVKFMREALDKDAKEEIRALQEEGEAERQKIRRGAGDRMEEAVRLVLEEIGIGGRVGQAG